MKILKYILPLILTFGIHAKSFDLDIKVETTKGELKSLKEVVKPLPNSKAILVDIWASWCSDCVAEAPLLDDFLKKNPHVVSVVYFSVDKNRSDWLKKPRQGGLSVRFPAGWSDKKFRKDIKLDWIPRYILMNKKGRILHYYAVKIEDPKLQAAIKATLEK